MSKHFPLLGLLLTLQVYLSHGHNTGVDQQGDIDWQRILRIIESEESRDIKRQKYDFNEVKDINNEDDTIQGLESREKGPDGINFEVKDEKVQAPTTTTAAPATENTTQPAPPKTLPHIQEDPESKSSHKHMIILNKDGLVFISIVTACSLAGFIGLIMAGVCWYKLNKKVKAASEVDYPAYGVTGPTKERIGPGPGDRKLAQSAQMYHYQHQKQQMIAMEKANGEMKHDASEDESEEENEEGDYTVYECPGLAPTGEMEVRNPLFTEAPQVVPGQDDQPKESQ